jgi:hypothetical protein
MRCEQCGCSGELGAGWVTFIRLDPDEREGEAWTGELCPPCAADQLGLQRDIAKTYVCVWPPLDSGTEHEWRRREGMV